MSIFLTGATGFIGGHLLRALSTQGYAVTCLVRRSSQRGHTWSQQGDALPDVRIVEGEWTRLDTWLEHLAGHEMIINTVGIIRESSRASFESVHTTTPSALFDEAVRVGVRKIIQVSAIGADEQAQSHFHRSKRKADQHLAQLGIPYVILRPSFVYGPGAHSMAFFARLARLPVTPVPGAGEYRVQPLHIHDLVRAIILAIQRDDLAAVSVDVGGSEVLTFNALLDILAQRQGRSHGARKLHIPWRAMRLVARVTDMHGGYGPISSDELGMLKRGSFADNGPFVALFGFEPMPFSAGIHLEPFS